MKRWINKEVESRLNAFWEMVEKEDPAHAASPYLNNIEYHYIAANNAEFEEEGGIRQVRTKQRIQQRKRNDDGSHRIGRGRLRMQIT